MIKLVLVIPMEEKTLLRKITDFIKNVIKVIIIFILSIFRSIFSQDKKNTKEIITLSFLIQFAQFYFIKKHSFLKC